MANIMVACAVAASAALLFVGIAFLIVVIRCEF